jgi:hypothetical protein
MRISQNNAFLNDVLRSVLKGEVIPAEFQRPYVWSDTDVLKLWSSILKKYPLGGFIVWSPLTENISTAIGRGRLGPVQVSKRESRVDLLLDGQNRLASFAWSASDGKYLPTPESLSPAEHGTWFRDGKFRFLVADYKACCVRFSTENDTECMPLHLAFNDSARWPWLREHAPSMSDQAMDWIDKLLHLIMSARVVVTHIEGATVQEARDAFLHIAQVGVPISEADFDRATQWACVDEHHNDTFSM